MTQHSVKRALDVVVALGGLIVLAPIMAIVAAAVRVQSPGPAIFRQSRIGRHGHPFDCYKFRSMYVGTRSLPTHETPRSSITPLGAVLRRSKIDELPQLLNVVRGDMSLVGPRPCLPTQHELIGHRQRLGVLELRPGITGLAQVLGVDMSEPRRLARLDAAYRERLSLSLDLRLLRATLLPVRSGHRRSIASRAPSGSAVVRAPDRGVDAAGA